MSYQEQENQPFQGQVQTNQRGSQVSSSSTGMEIAFTQARLNPRVVSQFNQKALALATIDRDIAASCFYKLKRKKRNPDGTEEVTVIEGPSIRLAEIVAACWGNLWLASSIKGEDFGSIVSEAKVCDMEVNNWITTENRRRITGRNGNRFSEDMVIMTANAASALALRNAVFTAVPRAYVNKILQAAKVVAVGSAKSLGERRQEMVSAFAKLGVDKARLLTYLERESMDDVMLPDLEEMIGLFTGIRDGDTTVDEAFPALKPQGTEKTPKEPVKTASAPDTTPASAPLNVEPNPEPTATPAQKQPEATEEKPSIEAKVESPSEPAKVENAVPNDETPVETRKRNLQDYNRKYASAKTAVGKDAVASAMEKVGIPVNTFPSRMSDEQLADGITMLDQLINAPKEGA